MGPVWGRQDPGVPHVGPMNLVIWEDIECLTKIKSRVWVLLKILTIDFPVMGCILRLENLTCCRF